MSQDSKPDAAAPLPSTEAMSLNTSALSPEEHVVNVLRLRVVNL